ncbi:phage tail protein [Shinella fusca]|uniref:Phage tail collar domain-containing protein n=1 Tax=Shinella fusca TaxID=544480 RepID=A0A7W7YR37_9HYPH|nr:hypothetical protein [Shinella fusca]MBB5040798.1 hypothetical protein [Shinella fusca]
MAKSTFLDFSTTAGDNTDCGGIGILGTNSVSNFDNAFRTLMAILRRDLDNGTVFATKSGAYTAVANDNNAFYEFTATATLTLTAAATLGADWHMMVFANGGDVTIDADGTELINGEETLVVADGDAAYLICTGSGFVAITIPSSSIEARIKFFGAGVALPTEDIGPIWHADYASVMTWQAYSANGATYTGYASVEIGTPRLDGQSTARAGFLKRNGGSFSKTTYAALWNWALHNGCVVSLGSWAAGAFVFADNGDGTFKVPDSRGEFERIWDDGRGVDTGRVFGSAQSDALKTHTHTLNAGRYYGNGSSSNVGWSADPVYLSDFGIVTGNPSTGTSAETRPRNVALLGIIKF